MNLDKPALQAEILTALAHPNRIRILNSIRNGMTCNSEISPALGIEQSNLSRHLKIMVQSGILVSHKEGLRVNYRVPDKRIFDILKLVEVIANKIVKAKTSISEA